MRIRLASALTLLLLLTIGADGGYGRQVPIFFTPIAPTMSRQAQSPATIPLSIYAGALRSVTVTVAKVARPFIFDTGGGETTINPEVASAIGCTPYGRTIGFRASGEQVAFRYCDDVSIWLGNVPIPHEQVGVFDLTSILPANAPPASGVVSLRSFRRLPVTIDLAMGKITVETADSLVLRTRGMQPLTIRVATGPTGAETSVYIGARVGGRRVWLLLDSGNGDPALVAPHVARMGGLIGREGEFAIEVDGLGPIRLPTRLQSMIYDGVLGAAFMEKWVFTLDLESCRAWAMPAGGSRLDGPLRTRWPLTDTSRSDPKSPSERSELSSARGRPTRELGRAWSQVHRHAVRGRYQ